VGTPYRPVRTSPESIIGEKAHCLDLRVRGQDAIILVHLPSAHLENFIASTSITRFSKLQRANGGCLGA